MYVATFLLVDHYTVARLDVGPGGLLGSGTAQLTTTDAAGVTKEMRMPLQRDAVEELGVHTAALIEAYHSLEFGGLRGEVTLVHASSEVTQEDLEQVLVAANVAHSIRSLATSASMQ